MFKALLYAKNEDEYQEAEKKLFEDETAKYPQFVQHIKKNILPKIVIFQRLVSLVKSFKSDTSYFITMRDRFKMLNNVIQTFV